MKYKIEPPTRITPAWAGKRGQSPLLREPDQDHPRVGGEKFCVPAGLFARQGSPPRGRGKDFTEESEVQGNGITPAWAGKSAFAKDDKQKRRDHPRVGGEKRCSWGDSTREQGSPPRGRGKVHSICLELRQHGITPAWAGKSPLVTRLYALAEDHPRVGGEKLSSILSSSSTVGSPPRGRGKEAGCGPQKLPAMDHPRVGGEKNSRLMSMNFMLGSPPRGRGKAASKARLLLKEGITPAWAGKS